MPVTSFNVSAAHISAAVQAALDARAARLVERESFAEATVGRDGRLHAPHDGYVWSNGQTYAGGEFLPEEGGLARTTKRILVDVAARDDFANLPGVDEIKFSREFNGLCYAYVVGPAYLVARIPELDERVIVPTAWDLPTGKTWKFSFKRWLQNEFAPKGAVDERELDKQMVGYYSPRVVAA